jgi:tungstate transport system permease protein
VDLVWQGLLRAGELLLRGDAEVWRITWLTLRVAGTATLFSVVIGVPLGLLLAVGRLPGTRLLITLANTGMGLPPVVVGLWTSLLLWRYGPLGSLGLIYTPAAMVLAQTIIATPIVAGFTLAGIASQDPRLGLQLRGLGASRWQLYRLLVREARIAILAGVIAGFGAVVSEVGASMMVGGNIRGQTRMLTTATVLEVGRGNFEVAIALSLILLLLTWAVTAVLTVLQQRGRIR